MLRFSLPLALVLLAFGLLLPGAARAQSGLTFSFANVEETEDGMAFDVVITGERPGTRLGDTQIYLNYNEAAFGASVAYSGAIAVELAEALTAHGRYRPPIINDNTATRVSITTEYVGQAETGLPLKDEPFTLMRVRLRRADAEAPIELAFDERLMTGQQFEADMATAYAPLLVLPNRAPDAEADTLREATGTILEVSGNLFALVPDVRPTTRWIPLNLPAALRQDGLRVQFSGFLEPIPPNVRMMGRPLLLTAVQRLDDGGNGD